MGEDFFFRDVSAVLTSNLIFIDHRLFSSISAAAPGGHLISSSAIKVDDISQQWRSNSSANTSGFSKMNFVVESTHLSLY